MSIIQQLAEIESKALKYKEQDTVYIYTQRPRTWETTTIGGDLSLNAIRNKNK